MHPSGTGDGDGASAGAASAPPSAPPGGRKAGDLVNGKYKLERRLDLREGRERQQAARGAFGEVWKALYIIQLGQRADTIDTTASLAATGPARSTAQQRAVKFIQPERADPKTLKRFTEVEPKALARLSHPYIARFYEIDWDGRDPFLAMEFVRGGPITTYADQERLTLDQRVELMVKVCEALQHVHNQGLVHRDLKPDNILVTEVDGGDGSGTAVRKAGKAPVPKLIDFGLAKSTSAEPLDRSIASEVFFVGTRPYASPEQFARREHEEVDRGADVYALGAILFELLCGVSPMHHVLTDPKSSTPQKESRCASEERPTLLAAFDKLPAADQQRIATARRTTPRALRAALHGALQWIQSAILRVEPKERISDVSHLREDLQNYLDGQPFRYVKKEPWLTKSVRRIRRNPVPFAATAGVVLALLLGLAGTLWQRAIAESNAADARAAELLATKNERAAIDAKNEESAQRATAELQAEVARQRLILSEAGPRLTTDPGLMRLILRELPAAPKFELPQRVRDDWLQQSDDRLQGRFVGHGAAITSVAWSPDGRRLATASDDYTARIWSADGTGEPVVLRGHGSSVTSIAWSPDGQRVATGSSDRTARVWNADGNGEPIILAGHTRAVRLIAWSPDSRRVATVCLDYDARLWNVDGAATDIVMLGSDVTVLAWSPDGERIATASTDARVRVWNGDGTREPIVLHGHHFPVTSVSWSHDGRRLATASGDRTARIWSGDGTGEPVVFEGHEKAVLCVAWSPDDRHLATASLDNTSRIWSADRTGKPIVLLGHEDSVVSVVWGHDARRLATASRDGTARIWNADGRGKAIVLIGHGGYVPVAWSRDGKRLATAFGAQARIWNADGTPEPVFLGDRDNKFMEVHWSPDGQLVTAAAQSGTVVTWNATGMGDPRVVEAYLPQSTLIARSPDGKQLATTWPRGHTMRIWKADWTRPPLVLYGHQDDVMSVAWSADGSQLVTGSKDGTARVWSTDTEGDPIVFNGHNAWVVSVAWSRDGKRLATGSSDGFARIWNADGRGEAIVLNGHEGYVHVAWSRDGKRLATASEDRTVRIWSADRTANPIISIPTEVPISLITWSPDGRRVATASLDGTARVWNADGTGESVVLKHGGFVDSIAWSPDGRRVATASDDKTVRLWLVDWSSLRAMLWHSTNAYLFKQERMDILGEDEATATAREAQDRAWVERKLEAERDGRPLPPPPRGGP